MSDNTETLIRKAVELADGWEITWEKVRPSDFTHVQMPGGASGPVFYLEDHAKPQWALDALAAQLVRQLDSSRAFAVVYRENTQVWVEPDDGPEDRIANCYGPDRTLNTIKAIVESGVLE